MNTNPILSIWTEEVGTIGVRFDRWDGSRAQYEWIIAPAGEDEKFTGTDLRMGSKSTTSASEALHALLDFLGAFAEAVIYSRRVGGTSENLDLFPEGLREWADAIGGDGFAMLAEDVRRDDD